ncbi:MAG: hypothetical protein WCO98_09860 [bacterium]
MTVTDDSKTAKSSTTVAQGIILVILSLCAILLPVVIRKIFNLTDSTDGAEFSGSVSALLSMALYVIEAFLYLICGWSMSQGKFKIASIYVIYGMLSRIFLSIITALILNQTIIDSLTKSSSYYWLYRIIEISITVIILLLPVTAIVRIIYHTENVKDNKNKVEQQFSFATKKINTDANIRVFRPEEVSDTSTHLTPPEGFSQVMPAVGITGTISVPSTLILEAVPEAKDIIATDNDLPIELQYVIPQISNATLWFTWQQLFRSEVVAAKFQDRWVKIPAKYYVFQIPREYYVSSIESPVWMTREAVPQENDLNIRGVKKSEMIKPENEI